MNPTEPLGLPHGSIRAILTLAFTGTVIFMWVTQIPVPEVLIGVNALVIGNYFGARGSAPIPEPVEKIEAPFIPGEPVA